MKNPAGFLCDGLPAGRCGHVRSDRAPWPAPVSTDRTIRDRSRDRCGRSSGKLPRGLRWDFDSESLYLFCRVFGSPLVRKVAAYHSEFAGFAIRSAREVSTLLLACPELVCLGRIKSVRCPLDKPRGLGRSGFG